MAFKTEELVAAIDSRDAAMFGSMLDDEVVFQFGNFPPSKGKKATVEVVDNFFNAIGGIKHDVLDEIKADDVIINHGNVTYTRKDGSDLKVPYSTMFYMNGDKIKDYYIFVDNSALFAPQ